MISEELREVAYQYGEAVAWREYYAEDAGYEFDDYNRQCVALWKKLIALGGYVDDEGSQLRDDVREHYHRGMDSVPDREPDWEEYWERMAELYLDDEDVYLEEGEE